MKEPQELNLAPGGITIGRAFTVIMSVLTVGGTYFSVMARTEAKLENMQQRMDYGRDQREKLKETVDRIAVDLAEIKGMLREMQRHDQR